VFILTFISGLYRTSADLYSVAKNSSLTSDRLTREAQTKYGCDKRAELEVRATAIARDSTYIIMTRHNEVLGGNLQ
jgi:hypothetical protein